MRPVKDVTSHVRQAKPLLKINDDLLGDKFLARKDIDNDARLPWEGVDANVALSEENKARYSPIFRFRAHVL